MRAIIVKLRAIPLVVWVHTSELGDKKGRPIGTHTIIQLRKCSSDESVGAQVDRNLLIQCHASQEEHKDDEDVDDIANKSALHVSIRPNKTRLWSIPTD